MGGSGGTGAVGGAATAAASAGSASAASSRGDSGLCGSAGCIVSPHTRGQRGKRDPTPLERKRNKWLRSFIPLAGPLTRREQRRPATGLPRRQGHIRGNLPRARPGQSLPVGCPGWRRRWQIHRDAGQPAYPAFTSRTPERHGSTGVDLLWICLLRGRPGAMWRATGRGDWGTHAERRHFCNVQADVPSVADLS